MKVFYTLTLLAAIHLVNAQDRPQFAGTQFWAMTVSDAGATSKWYEDTFQLKLMKEVTFEKGKVRIIGNENLVVEILEIAGSKSVTDCSLDANNSHLLQGIFKTGFYVSDIAAAERYFKSKGVTIKHGIFDDSEMKAKSFIMIDLNQTMIQVLQRN